MFKMQFSAFYYNLTQNYPDTCTQGHREKYSVLKIQFMVKLL